MPKVNFTRSMIDVMNSSPGDDMPKVLRCSLRKNTVSNVHSSQRASSHVI